MAWDRGEQLYEGKAKRVWSTPRSADHVLIEFKDDATAFNGVKKASIEDKGVINCAITTHIFALMESAGVPTHFVEQVDSRHIACHALQIIPVEVVIRNYCAGSLAKRYGRPEGAKLPAPLVEYFYKSDELDDPLMTADHAVLFGWATLDELKTCSEMALRVNDVLAEFWSDLGVDLVDFKLEFGRTRDGRIVLADEITPDGSRLWEKGTWRKLDKDVFRRDLGSLTDTYRELYRRVFGRDLGQEG
jgi:phosphoribosylaminoimidazole-succinocarboxamide synthase